MADHAANQVPDDNVRLTWDNHPESLKVVRQARAAAELYMVELAAGMKPVLPRILEQYMWGEDLSPYAIADKIIRETEGLPEVDGHE